MIVTCFSLWFLLAYNHGLYLLVNLGAIRKTPADMPKDAGRIGGAAPALVKRPSNKQLLSGSSQSKLISAGQPASTEELEHLQQEVVHCTMADWLLVVAGVMYAVMVVVCHTCAGLLTCILL